MPQNQPWLQFFPKDELSDPAISILTGDQYMLFMKFRQAAFVGGPLPNNELILEKLARTFGISRYKFKKIWPVLRSFFEETFEGFQYPEDEEKRNQRLVIVSKRKMAGMLGAEARWGIKGTNSMTNAMANAWQNSPPEPEPKPQSETMVYPPPPTPSAPIFDRSPTAGGGPIPPQSLESEQNQQQHPPDRAPDPGPKLVPTISTSEYQAICHRAIELHMAVPGYKLASRIRQKFPHLEIEQIIPLLVRWEGQVSAGLWKSKTLEDFELEAARQLRGPRKLTQREQQRERLLARARERDKAAGVG